MLPPLLETVISDDLEAVKRLLDNGANIDEQSVGAGDTALMFAACRQNLPIVQYLLDRGADATLKNNSGYTALYFARSYKNEAIISLLESAEIGDRWSKISDNAVAFVTCYVPIHKKLTEIFNFERRERLLIAEDIDTKASSMTSPISFDEVPADTLRTAWENFKKLGGEADENFVLQGVSQLNKQGSAAKKLAP